MLSNLVDILLMSAGVKQIVICNNLLAFIIYGQLLRHGNADFTDVPHVITFHCNGNASFKLAYFF